MGCKNGRRTFRPHNEGGTIRIDITYIESRRSSWRERVVAAEAYPGHRAGCWLEYQRRRDPPRRGFGGANLMGAVQHTLFLYLFVTVGPPGSDTAPGNAGGPVEMG